MEDIPGMYLVAQKAAREKALTHTHAWPYDMDMHGLCNAARFWCSGSVAWTFLKFRQVSLKPVPVW